MSKEIDFSKAPEGATHYAVNRDREIIWYRSICREGYEFYCEYDIGSGGYFDGWRKNKGNTEYHAIPIHEQWSIYNNTKPLKDLTYEQAAELFRWRMSGGLIECYLGSGMAFFDKNSIYRAKKKSDRELFIEEAMRSVDLRGGDGEKDIYGKLFDSGKFKLVEQAK